MDRVDRLQLKWRVKLLIERAGPLDRACAPTAWTDLVEEAGNEVLVEVFTPDLLAAVAEERRVAATVLGAIAPDRRVAPIAAYALDDPLPDLRAAAAELVARHRPEPRLVDVLIAAMDDQHPGVRVALAKSLGWLGSPAATNRLIAALADRSWAVRCAAFDALCSIAGFEPRWGTQRLVREQRVVGVPVDAVRGLRSLRAEVALRHVEALFAGAA